MQIQYFAMEFLLSRLRDRGKLSWQVKRIRHRGRLVVKDVRDQNRTVRVATFETVDKTPVPPLRDAVLVDCTASWLSLSGTEETTEGALEDVRGYAQEWHLIPVEDREVMRLESIVGRLNKRLHDLGVVVEWLPGPTCRIPGERDD